MNVKAGDLAILIKSFTNANNGSICEVERYAGFKEWPDGLTMENAWYVKFPNPIRVWLVGDDGELYPSVQSKAIVDDSWLKPISGLPDDVDDVIVIPKDETITT